MRCGGWRELVTDGATVVGRRPDGSPSLADDPGEHERLCDQLWGTGRVVDTGDLAAALRDLGVTPQLAVRGAELPMISRRVGAQTLTFLTTPRTEPVTVVLSTPGIRLTAWDPVKVRRWALPEAGTGYSVTLPPLGSVFVLPGDAPPLADPLPVTEVTGDWTLTLPDTESVSWSGGPRAWTDLGFTAFSGVGTYRTRATIAELPAGPVYLSREPSPTSPGCASTVTTAASPGPSRSGSRLPRRSEVDRTSSRSMSRTRG